MARTKFYCGPKGNITREELGEMDATGKYVVDEKYDGCWCMIRVTDSEIVHMESRVGKEFTGADTDGLYGVRLWEEARNVILIGEVEPDYVGGRQIGTRRLKLFDIIEANGVDLTGLALTARRARLEALYAEFLDTGYISHRDNEGGLGCGELLVHLAEQRTSGFQEFFDEVVARSGEGLVVKKKVSYYQPKNSDGKIKEWMKCKPNRFVDYVCTGHGLAEKGTPNLQLSLWKDNALVKVLTTGIPKELWHLPAESFVGKVLEVGGMEMFPSGALRHAHIQRIRDDKPSEDCTHEAAMNARKVA